MDIVKQRRGDVNGTVAVFGIGFVYEFFVFGFRCLVSRVGIAVLIQASVAWGGCGAERDLGDVVEGEGGILWEAM
jgi:hypothetical protein